jgi:hypothetical protein
MDYNKTLDAFWCIDSEIGERLLIDRQTGQVIAKTNKEGEIIDAN